ncbi:unnamed protein product [Chrysoparadoxa australica]
MEAEKLHGDQAALLRGTEGCTALHLAVASESPAAVRKLMLRWRHHFTRELGRKLAELDVRRDSFLSELSSKSIDGNDKAYAVSHQVRRFHSWLLEERLRLLRCVELRCEECWRRVLSAKDDHGRTALHWAASLKGSEEVMEALLRTGRANLGHDEAPHQSAMDDALLSRAVELIGKGREPTVIQQHLEQIRHGFTARHCKGHPLFPRNEMFHFYTGTAETFDSARLSTADPRAPLDGQMREGTPTGMNRSQPPSIAKVAWFCRTLGDRASAAAKASSRGEIEYRLHC